MDGAGFAPGKRREHDATGYDGRLVRKSGQAALAPGSSIFRGSIRGSCMSGPKCGGGVGGVLGRNRAGKVRIWTRTGVAGSNLSEEDDVGSPDLAELRKRGARPPSIGASLSSA